MNKEFLEKVNELIGEYRDELAERGIECTASRKYAEVKADPMTTRPGNGAILTRSAYKHREKKYRNQSNRYYCVVLMFSPTEKQTLKKSECREYAFLTQATARAHTGLEPEKKRYSEENALKKIKKRIIKILKKAGNQPAEAVCRDTIFDAFRYSASNKYAYKKRFLGKESYEWEFIFTMLVAVVVILAMIIFGVTLWILTK